MVGSDSTQKNSTFLFFRIHQIFCRCRRRRRRRNSRVKRRRAAAAGVIFAEQNSELNIIVEQLSHNGVGKRIRVVPIKKF